MELLGIRLLLAELLIFCDVLTKFLQKALGSTSCLVMNLKIKISLCALNRQPLGFHDALYTSMSATNSRYHIMDPQWWVSRFRTPPMMSMCDSIEGIGHHSSHILLP